MMSFKSVKEEGFSLNVNLSIYFQTVDIESDPGSSNKAESKKIGYAFDLRGDSKFINTDKKIFSVTNESYKKGSCIEIIVKEGEINPQKPLANKVEKFTKKVPILSLIPKMRSSLKKDEEGRSFGFSRIKEAEIKVSPLEEEDEPVFTCTFEKESICEVITRIMTGGSPPQSFLRLEGKKLS